MAGKNERSSSITNVAALANVSIATVSRVLSGKRGKDDDIARRVRAAAEQLNYSVNYAASSLRSDVTNSIGLVIPSATESFSAQLLDELEYAIDADAQQLLIGIGADRSAQTDRIESLLSRHVDGLIVVPGTETDLTETLDRHADSLPIVQIGGHQQSFKTSMVSIDESASMELIMRHLVERGSHAVAYMAGKEVSFESAELFTMFHTQVRSYRLVSHTDWNQFGERTVQRGYDCSMRLFSKDNRPDALVCADDAVAFGAMVALHTLGLRVPEDVRIVGFDDSPLAATTMPTLTSVHPPFEQIVSESLRLIASETGMPAHISLPPQLMIRESTGYAKV
ncbi:LacI family DNA-binding transcriptional regulator [Bifidobacterium merycicum]|nr:LacI family DNA-binding transcriptional regulator [Bifidobacterium sp.]